MKARVPVAACISFATFAAALPGSLHSAPPPVAPNYDIYSVAIDGGAPTRLTVERADEVSPSMSPDGTTVVYVRGRDLWLMDADGRNQRLLAAAPEEVSYEEPSWSATGRYLAFTEWDLSGCSGVPYHCAVPSVGVIRADGSGLRRIRARAMSPRWSSRGERLVLAGNVAPYEIEPTSIDAVSLDGSARRLAQTRFVNSPSWSPDGKRVAYARGGRNAGVFIVRADGSGNRSLARAGQRPAWSPAGGRIALQVGGRLYLAHARGRARLRRLAFANWYAWSRKGGKLGLVDWRLSVIRPDGRSFRVLCCEDRFGLADAPPAWSRTGDRLFYAFKQPNGPPS